MNALTVAYASANVLESLEDYAVADDVLVNSLVAPQDCPFDEDSVFLSDEEFWWAVTDSQ